MAEKIIVVQSTEQKAIAKGDNAGNMYLAVTDKDGKKFNIFNTAFFGLFQDGFAVKLIGEQSGQYFNVSGVEPVKDAEVIQKVKEAPVEIAPQAIGMMTKEIGDHIRAGTLTSVFGKKIGVELVKWYRGQALGISQVPFDGKDLPEYQ